MKPNDPGVIYRGRRVLVYDGNTEIHAVWYGVYLINGRDLLNGFSGDTAAECASAREKAIGYAKKVDKELR